MALTIKAVSGLSEVSQSRLETEVTKRPQPKGGSHVERAGRAGGGRSHEPPEPDYLRPEEMLDWLRDEVLAVSKAAELRLRDATIIVTEYAKGNISATEANKRFLDYSGRWGDALYGIVSLKA
jgi:hypothetical protein